MRHIVFVLAVAASLVMAACDPSDSEQTLPEIPDQPETPGNGDNGNSTEDMENKKLILAVNGRTFSATMEENGAVETLAARLEQGPLSIEMRDYGDMEKVGSLGFRLPVEDTGTVTGPGDIVLYQGSSIVIFYGSNTWEYTPLGHVDGVAESDRGLMLELLGGKGDVILQLSLE